MNPNFIRNIAKSFLFSHTIIIYRYSGKLQALSAVTKDQRREYKSKFVDMDIEFQRMKERLETIHLILDDMQVCSSKSLHIPKDGWNATITNSVFILKSTSFHIIYKVTVYSERKNHKIKIHR